MNQRCGEQLHEHSIHLRKMLGNGPWRKGIKQQASRKFRRLAKLLEDPPTKRKYAGWSL